MSIPSDPTRPSISSVMDTLQGVANETRSVFTSSLQLELFSGATLIVFWDAPSDSDQMPKEAHLLFSVDKDPKGRFQIGFVYDPARYLWAIGEGLSEEEATSESRRVVERMEDVVGYLTGHQYTWIKPKNAKQII